MIGILREFALKFNHHSILRVCCGTHALPPSRGNVVKVFSNLLGALGDFWSVGTGFLSPRCHLEFFVQVSVRKKPTHELRKITFGRNLATITPLLPDSLFTAWVVQMVLN